MIPRRRTTLVLFLGFLAAASARGAVVQGIVTSAAGNVRLPGKVVQAYDANGVLRGNGSTDAAGMYTLTLPSGAYRLLAYDPAGELATAFYGGADSFDSTPLAEVRDGAPVQANFSLVLGGRITGTVSAGATAVPGAVVEAYNLSGTRRGFTTTNASGEYSLVLPPGDYKVFAYDANGIFAGEFHQNVRAFADATPVRVTAPNAANLAFALERVARVTGFIRDAGTGAGLPAIFVYAYTAAGARVAETTTDPAGAFRFELGPGQYRFVSGDPSRAYGPAYYAGARSFTTANVVTLTPGQQLAGVTLLAERSALIRGRVPAGLTVVAYNLDGTQHNAAQADANGDYVLVVAPGDYKVAVIDPTGAYAAQFHVSTTSFLTAHEIVILGGQTLTGIDFSPPRAGRFTGGVRDAASTQPLAGMVVVAYDTNGLPVGEATTASNGTYTLAVAPGQYRLLAFDIALQYATAYAGGAVSYDATVPLSVAADVTVSADFTMRRGVRVSGTVRNQGGDPISGVEIFAVDLSGNRVAAATTNAGAFAMVLLPGTYRFVAFDPQSRYFTEQYAGGAQVTIGSQTPAPLGFVLNPVKRRRIVRH